MENKNIQNEKVYSINYKDGVQHLLTFNKGNQVIKEAWIKNQELHSSSGKEYEPTVTEYYGNGVTKSKSWFKNGKLHRDYKDCIGVLPAEIEYYENHNRWIEKWYKNGEPFCGENGNKPYQIIYFKDGTIASKKYCKKNFIERLFSLI